MRVEEKKKNVINKLIFFVLFAGTWKFNQRRFLREGTRSVFFLRKKNSSWPKFCDSCHAFYFGNKSIYDGWWIFYEIEANDGALFYRWWNMNTSNATNRLSISFIDASSLAFLFGNALNINENVARWFPETKRETKANAWNLDGLHRLITIARWPSTWSTINPNSIIANM